MALDLLAAVDVATDRLARADRLGPDPFETVAAWWGEGARWLHLVDLDAAYGRGSNRELLARIVAEFQGLGGRVQLSGGVTDAGSLAAALDAGAARVNLAASALRDRPWCESVLASYADRLAVSVDVRAGLVVPRGPAGEPLGDAMDCADWLARAGARCLVVTDIDRDGAMAGPDLDLLREVCARLAGTGAATAVIASGGVASLDDLRALAALEPLGVRGVITGRALLSGAFTVADALAALRT